ncbi:MAG: YtxH domain-containing protein [Patescibacteria group bacterium]|nr:YtxH domain-containing protein [Patescibacteria group bacterium]MCL5431786.1 YtxH domain-containing protein [Patescibacteria group bacterium]
MNNDRSGTLLTGLAIGAAIGAGLTFLFGTKKGAEVREKIKDQYPDLFDRVDDVLEGLEEKYGDVVSEMEKIEEKAPEEMKEEVAHLGRKVKELKHTFLKSGRPLHAR